jgi:hypothetical protein
MKKDGSVEKSLLYAEDEQGERINFTPKIFFHPNPQVDAALLVFIPTKKTKTYSDLNWSQTQFSKYNNRVPHSPEFPIKKTHEDIIAT